jgi:hypothetical protein
MFEFQKPVSGIVLMNPLVIQSTHRQAWHAFSGHGSASSPTFLARRVCILLLPLVFLSLSALLTSDARCDTQG